MRRKRVAILGCGPAGLFAAHGATLRGADVRIFSKRRKSELFGAQFLQWPIFGLAEPEERFEVCFQLQGDFLAYKRKVYGDSLPDPDAVTAEEFFHKKDAWDIRMAYSRAWELYASRIEGYQIGPEWLDDLLRSWRPHLVISTIPKPALCGNRPAHAFESQRLWAIGDAPERGIFVDGFEIGHNSVNYNGEESPSWHRAANINGFRSVEWPDGPKPPLADVAQIEKPVQSTCICWPQNRVAFAGRYGGWHWAGQAHEGFNIAWGRLA